MDGWTARLRRARNSPTGKTWAEAMGLEPDVMLVSPSTFAALADHPAMNEVAPPPPPRPNRHARRAAAAQRRRR